VKKFPRNFSFLLSILAIGFCLALFLIGFWWYRSSHATHELPQVGPSVMITSPTPGEAAIPATSISIDATVIDNYPIHHIELWLDAELAQTIYNDDLQNAAALDVSFYIPLTEGDHFLFVRAVDTSNLVGQSMPIRAVGQLSIAGDGPFDLVEIAPGESLDDTLEASGVDLDSVLPYNPGLGGGNAPPGGIIAVPPASGEENAESPAPKVPPQQQKEGNALVISKIFPIDFPLYPLLQGVINSPPVAPTGLQASVENCQVILTWTDNSSNEAGYNIWATGLGLPPRVVARAESSPGIGATWVKLDVIHTGDFIYWVEAYNGLGTQSSSYAKITVPEGCPSQLGEKLDVKVVDFNTSGPYDSVYCYISSEGNPEVRFPSGQQSIPVIGGQGNTAAMAAGADSFSLTLPKDGDLLLEGECWGWAGNTLTKLGNFQRSCLSEEWDGSRIALLGDLFEIGIQILLTQPEEKMVTFGLDDPSILSPHDLKLESSEILTDLGMDDFISTDQMLDRTLSWQWDGNPSDITGFTVLINSVPYKQINSPNARSTDIKIPGSCGTKISITVIAVAGDRQSPPSKPVVENQHQCTIYALVDFMDVAFAWTNDSINPTHKCDEMQAYLQIGVEEIFTPNGTHESIHGRKTVKTFNGYTNYRTVKCLYYDLNYIAGSWYTQKEKDPTQIIFPIRILNTHRTSIVMTATIWDLDDNKNDVIASYASYFNMDPQEAQKQLNNMTGSNPFIRHYYCHDYGNVYDGDAESVMNACVDLYRENPSTGTALLPSNSIPQGNVPSEPSEEPGLSFQTLADLEIRNLFIDTDKRLIARIGNNGPDDVENFVEFTISIKTNDPNLMGKGKGWVTKFGLNSGALTDLDTGIKDFDVEHYDYNITMKVVPYNDSSYYENNLDNNSRTESIEASNYFVAVDPLMVDLEIIDISRDYRGLIVNIRNNGPAVLTGQNIDVVCKVTAVNRLTGETGEPQEFSNSVYGMNLTVGESHALYPRKIDATIDTYQNWYMVSCQIKSEGSFSDLSPQNNFLTKPIY
jgi:hypothetical protein